MDPDLRLAGVPAQPLAALDALVRRAGEMSEPQVRNLARQYRARSSPGGVGIQDAEQLDRRRRRARALRLAIARSGSRSAARRLESACHRAVRSALAGSPSLRSLTRLGVVDDAAAAVVDAALAILVRDRLGAELKRDLSASWDTVMDAPAAFVPVHG